MRRLLVLLSVFVALALFAPSVMLAQPATPEPADAGLARTDVRHLLPFGPDGVNAALTVTGTIAGSCTAESLALPHRPDAWDCTGDDLQIYDPCFEDPFAAEDAPVELACLATPFTNEVVLLTADGPLPRDKETPAQELFAPFDLPWALELANGDRCVLLHEIDAVLAGETVHYGCDDGGTIFGTVDRRFPVWTVNYLAPDAIASGLVDVAVAWS